MPTFSRWRFATLAALLALLVATTGSANDLSHLVRARQQESGAPGMTAAVITSDSIEVFASGLRRADRPQRVTKDDAFGIGSDAKAMLATVVATEVEAGRLRWDTTLGEVMPEIAATGRAVYRTVTLAQLLNHQAGLPQLLTQEDLVVVPRLRGPVVLQRMQFVHWAVRQQPLARPGAAVLYSNAGYVVAAAMLERVTGQRYELLMQRRLFAPLGITARFEWPAAGGRRRQPWGHLFVAGEAAPVDPDDPSTQFPEWLNPAGNVSMNARDFGRFVQLHLRGLRGTPDFLAPATFVHLHTPTLGYAYGWVVTETAEGLHVSFHDGSSSLFYAFMILVPELDVAAVVLANTESPQIPDVASRLAVELINAKVQQP